MRIVPASAFRWAADALSRVLSPLRIVAILPGLLLAAFWASGEAALVAAAASVPVTVLLMAAARRRQFPPVARPPDSSLISRDDLACWLDATSISRSVRSAQTAVIVLMIDGIPDLEKRFGRSAATGIYDEILRRLNAILRRDDTMATLGGNAIALGLRKVRRPETENLLRMARRLQSVCDAPFQAGVSRVYCTVSMGIAAEIHVAKPTPATLIDAAERAAEFASSSGPGSIRFFSEGLFSEKEDERRHAQALSSALETGEIFAWFQPQISFKGDRIVGFEALARWDRPEHGIILPGAFLKDMTRAGLSQRLSEVILKQALTALNAWDAAGFDVPAVSVNFSGDDLRNPRLADYVLWELDRFGLDPGRLVVEVLESVIADQHEEAISRTLRTLSAAGCRIDLDDFGTGFTSIINIRRFDVSRIKIDRCLVSRLDRDADQRRMVSALLSFTTKLGIDALAEGVETETERETLRKLGCPFIQGYVAARPMPLGESLLWLEDKQEASVARLPMTKTASA